MSQVLTNNTTLQYAIESSIGTLPGSPLWRAVEFNSIGAYGAQIETKARSPISPTRGRRAGSVVNLTAAVEYETDATMDALSDFAEGLVFSEFANVEFDLKSSSGTLPPPAVSGTDDFTIDAASALLAGKMVYTAAAARSLVYALGYTNAANNGIHELNADVATSNTTVQVASTLVSETPSTNASLQVCGVRIGDTDLTLTVSGSTATLVSAGDVADWSTLGLQVGQFILIGSPDGSGGVTNALNASTTDDTYGMARITQINGATLSLDKLASTLAATADNTGEGDCDILFGRFLRNVATSADADDARYLERSYQFEQTFANLGGVGTDEYEYVIGNFANEMALNMPLTDFATVSFGFVGTNADDITQTRKTGASSGIGQLRTTAINTSSDLSLTTDVISLASDVCFKSVTLTIRNNVTPENCLGTLGASFVNAGLFEVNLEGQMMFTDKAIINAIKNNDTVTFAAVLSNNDGAFVIDLPSCKFGNGGREYPVGESVLVNIDGEAFNDSVGTIPDVSLGLSLFPVGLDSDTV